jgi:glycosyltransferase involved in cell wall biosynthesis
MEIMIVGVVGYRFDYYPYLRNIVDIIPGIEYKKTKDVFARVNAGARILNRLTKRELISTFDLNNQFYDFNLNHVDLLHFFNGVSYGRIPWVSTFETILPRFKRLVQSAYGSSSTFVGSWNLRRAFDALASSPCKQIIAISTCSANMQRAMLSEFKSYEESIAKKMVVMHPPQDPVVAQFTDKQIDIQGPIKFIFVGNTFFRKGGREILETIKFLRETYKYDIHLTVVSSFYPDDYVIQVTASDILWATDFISQNKDWITYFKHLPNSAVLEEMKRSHIGLLPTYADTYGYTVLEFQAAGCPVITTNVRALPEINDNDKGWVIEVPKNELGEAIYTTEENRIAISTAIRSGLINAAHEIFADRSIIPEKSAKAISAIKANHSRVNFAAQMKKIYLEAINS